MLVERFLEDSAQRFPEKTALVCEDRQLTYRQIDEACNRLARGLIVAGVRRGDRVAIYLENSVEAVLSIFATLKAGGVFVIVNPTTKPDKLVFFLNNCRATALVTHARHEETLRAIAARTPHTKSIVVAGRSPFDSHADDGGKRRVSLEQLVGAIPADSARPDTRCIDLDLAALIYTSGSTGTPKGVMLTHLNIVSAATSVTTYLENTAADIILDVLPLSFDYGLYQVLMGFKVGGTVVLERSFAYPHQVLERLVSERVTGFPIVPTISAMLLQMDLRAYDFSRLRYITNTAAALPPAHIRALRALLPNVRLFSMYGLTECKRASYLPPDQIDERPNSVGKAIPNEEVYLVDGCGNRLTCGVGELVIRGSNVMKGYWEMPDETAKVLKPGPLPGEFVLHSGDLFRMTEDGYLYFLGRMDDIIKSRGEKVSPREVENVIYELAGVAEAVVVGVPDAVLGQAIKAVVRLRRGATLTEQDIRRHCRDRLEDLMVPKMVQFVPAIPRTSSGKIDRRRLQGQSAGVT